MFTFRGSVGPAGRVVDIAFTDRIGGVSAAPFDELNLAVGSSDPAVFDNVERVRAEFGPGDEWVHLRQVHGSHVYLADLALVDADLALPAADLALVDADLALPAADLALVDADLALPAADLALVDADLALPEADGVVSTSSGLTLAVRAADCVPIVLADPVNRVIGAAHAGRVGMAAGVAIETVRVMRAHGATNIQAWIGPYVCGACYEVPADLMETVAALVPAAAAETSWGTLALDLGAGLRSQLEPLGVQVHDVSRCTRESADLYSYRRDGACAGRHVGIIRIRP